MNKQELIKFYLEQGVLLSPSILEIIDILEIPLKNDFSVINNDTLEIIKHKITINIDDFEKSIILKEKYHNARMYDKFIDYIKTQSLMFVNKSASTSTISSAMDLVVTEKPATKALSSESSASPAVFSSEESLQQYREAFIKKNRIKIIMSYNEKSRKRTVTDFVNYFNARYKELEKILRSRQELQNLTSISRINSKREKENVAIIGYVYDKSVTKNKNIMLTIEDPTGVIKVVVSQHREDLYKIAEEIQLDELIGVTGMCDSIIFANALLYPDIPLTKELKKSPEEGYFLLLSDTQFGNKLFLEKEFSKLLSWINGETGSDIQKEIASKIKYIFILGDLVEGVGIYPDQEYHLTVIDIYDQYKGFAALLKKIPPHIPIIIIPGNHDVGRISEPQPKLENEYTKSINDIPNVISVSNPALINIYEQPEHGFEGFNILLYHGYSFFYYAEHIQSIRQKGTLKRPDLVMRYLLQRRHLAPTHASSLYIPDPKKDYLAIDKVPDFFFSGHIHRASVTNYRNVTCINASCWTSKSAEEERRGLEPQPGRAFIINMQTREVKIMNFLSRDDQEKESEELRLQSEELQGG